MGDPDYAFHCVCIDWCGCPVRCQLSSLEGEPQCQQENLTIRLQARAGSRFCLELDIIGLPCLSRGVRHTGYGTAKIETEY